jgi:transposase
MDRNVSVMDRNGDLAHAWDIEFEIVKRSLLQRTRRRWCAQRRRHEKTDCAVTANGLNRETIPGIGPISATAIAALAPPVETFAKGRDFAAWLGLTPLQRSTGGKQKLGATSKMGEHPLRRLLIIGSSAVVRKNQAYSSCLELAFMI